MMKLKRSILRCCALATLWLPKHSETEFGFPVVRRDPEELGGNYMDNGASSYRRFLDGDESAFDEIMKELFRSLVFFIDRYVHDVHSAEDIAIDTFSDLIVHRHRYNFKVTLKTYLFMIGRSRALDHIRHRRIINFVELPEAEKLSDDEKSLEDDL